MELETCTLCLNKYSPKERTAAEDKMLKIDSRASDSDNDDPVNLQFQIIFLLRKILEIPEEKFCNFLRDYGDPCSWVNCCGSCSILVAEGKLIFEQIAMLKNQYKILQRQYENLKSKIKGTITQSAKFDKILGDESTWGVKEIIRSCIIQGVSNSKGLIKEEEIEDFSCSNLNTSSDLRSFLVDDMNLESAQNPSVLGENDVSMYPINDLSYEPEKCDGQVPLEMVEAYDCVEVIMNPDIKKEVENIPEELDAQSETFLVSSVSHMDEYLAQNIIWPSNAPADSEGKSYKCEISRKSSKQSSDLEGLKRVHTGDGPYKCSICNNKEFLERREFQIHMNIHSQKKPKCDICGKIFHRDFDLKSHTKVHTGEKPYKCSVCGKCFGIQGNLKSHERIHTGEKPYKCKFCEQHFSTTSKLNTHERNHSKKPPYKCKLSEKELMAMAASNINMYGKIPSGEPPYNCSICNKTFLDVIEFQIHLSIHSQERPKCELCGKVFQRTCYLIKHQTVHTGERPHKCSVCSKSFKYSNDLKVHVRVHTAAEIDALLEEASHEKQN